MPVVIYRQPWFWAVIIAVVAILGFVIVTAASNKDRAADSSTTIVQQPAPSTTPNPAVVPVPTPSVTPSTPSQPVSPVPPVKPVEPAKPAPPVVKEKVIVKEKPVPVPVPVPSTPSTSTPSSNGTADQFGHTGVSRTLRLEGQRWKANGTVDMDATQLKSAGVSENSTEMFADTNATEPYTTLYVPVPDQAGKYVRFAPAQ
jgi:outer membrane biosynthesis protein TonB